MNTLMKALNDGYVCEVWKVGRGAYGCIISHHDDPFSIHGEGATIAKAVKDARTRYEQEYTDD